MNKLPLYLADIIAGEDKMLSLSFVKAPATKYHYKVIEQTDKGAKVFIPILPANTPIYRNNEAYGEHYVMFLPNVITDIMRDAQKRNIPFDYEHQGTPIKGIEWIESFQIDYKAGKLYKPYQSLPDGTWGGIFFIPNIVFPISEPKNRSLDFLGISISGIFSYYKMELVEAIEFYNSINVR